MKKRKTRFSLAAGFMGAGLAIAAVLFGRTVSASQPQPSQLTASQIPGSFQIPQFGIPKPPSGSGGFETFPSPLQSIQKPQIVNIDFTSTPTIAPTTTTILAPGIIQPPPLLPIGTTPPAPTTQTVNIVTGAVQPSAFAPSPGAAVVQPVGVLFPSGVNAQSFQAWWSNLTGAISALQAGNATFSSSLTNLPISNRLPDGTPFPGGLNSSDLPILQSAFNAYLKTAQALGLA